MAFPRVVKSGTLGLGFRTQKQREERVSTRGFVVIARGSWSIWNTHGIRSATASHIIPKLHGLLDQPQLYLSSHLLYIPMRIPTFPSLIRTFYRLSTFSTRTPQNQPRALQPFARGTILKSMPTIPFLSNFFSTSSSPKMSYPVQKSDDEWRAVLSKGMSPYPVQLECPTTLRSVSNMPHRAIPGPSPARH
jgi:hypothetical protein